MNIKQTIKNIHFQSWVGIFIMLTAVAFYFLQKQLPVTLIQLVALSAFGLYLNFDSKLSKIAEEM